jgi:hypothetical protein
MKKKLLIFILYLIASSFLTFITVRACFSQIPSGLIPVKADWIPEQSEEIPAKPEWIPAQSDRIPEQSKEIPVKTEQIPAKSDSDKSVISVTDTPRTRTDSLRIIGDAVNKGFYYRDLYFNQLKITGKYSRDFEILYKSNSDLFDLLLKCQSENTSKLPAVLISAGVTSIIWFAVYLLLNGK